LTQTLTLSKTTRFAIPDGVQLNGQRIRAKVLDALGALEPNELAHPHALLERSVAMLTKRRSA
jgi:hypothetical protein